MCGLPGAGKTTRARELELQFRAVRLTPDEWITGVLGPDPGYEALHAARDPTESLQWSLAARLLTLGIDVILDFGFWSREEREQYRNRAAALGAGSQVHFVDAVPEVLLDRLGTRRRERPANTFVVTDAQLAKWSKLFQPPTADELEPRPAAETR
jgi:predicted kinase